ncbi:MAG: hypothetical protein Q8P42_11470 [Gallionella sp.]|nr:hypothetical protein [Gallionella sp.]
MGGVPILPKYRPSEEKELVLLGRERIFGLDEAALTTVKEMAGQENICGDNSDAAVAIRVKPG